VAFEGDEPHKCNDPPAKKPPPASKPSPAQVGGNAVKSFTPYYPSVPEAPPPLYDPRSAEVQKQTPAKPPLGPPQSKTRERGWGKILGWIVLWIVATGLLKMLLLKH
jgi:hypothetical protein